jgi:inosine/xanthosine triphosphatase
MIVAVGSKNPVKIRPVRKIFKKYFKNITIVSHDVPSGVSEQPLSEEEMYKGALNRARQVLKIFPNAEYGVGIEGGIVTHPIAGKNEKSVVVIANSKEDTGIGISAALFLPEKITRHILDGKTLNDAIDKEFGTNNIGKGIGAYGIFTKGTVTRASGMEDAIAFALSRFLHNNLF